LTAVHTAPLRRQIREDVPEARIASIRLAHGTFVTDADARAFRTRVRKAYDIAEDAIVFGVFGGLAPDKRVPQVLEELDAIVPYAPSAHLLLAGSPQRHYDVAADGRGKMSRVGHPRQLTTSR
jgi:predicted O-linked N-acetylglucosamine transferase (SPINDLY family)